MIVQLDNPRLEVRYGLPHYGGGRGVFATSSFRVGEVVLSEEPVFVGPEEAESPERRQVLEQVALLCPVQLDDIPPPMLAKCREAHASTVAALRAVEAGQEQPLDDDSLLRLLLAMQMNAFYSGVYIKLALVNHSCKPNCHKLVPEGSRRSEIVATRDIAPGEEIMMNYMQPFGQSSARRRAAFEEQHMWPIGPSPFPPEMDALVDTPSSATYASTLRAADELEDSLEDVAQSLQMGSLRPADALQQLEKLRADAAAVLGPRHLAQARVRSMLIDVIQRCAELGTAQPAHILLLVQCAMELLPIQEEAQGSQHCEVASTLDSLAQAMAFLMSADVRLLIAAYPQWDTISKISKAQYDFLKRSKAIQKLYA